jgi:hypothetical protein
MDSITRVLSCFAGNGRYMDLAHCMETINPEEANGLPVGMDGVGSGALRLCRHDNSRESSSGTGQTF